MRIYKQPSTSKTKSSFQLKKKSKTKSNNHKMNNKVLFSKIEDNITKS